MYARDISSTPILTANFTMTFITALFFIGEAKKTLVSNVYTSSLLSLGLVGPDLGLDSGFVVLHVDSLKLLDSSLVSS